MMKLAFEVQIEQMNKLIEEKTKEMLALIGYEGEHNVESYAEFAHRHSLSLTTEKEGDTTWYNLMQYGLTIVAFGEEIEYDFKNMTATMSFTKVFKFRDLL